MAKNPSLYPTARDTEFTTDRASGDTITSSAYDVLESAVLALEDKLGIDFGGLTNAISAVNLSATTVSATNLRATTVTATNVSAANLSATELCATTLCATNWAYPTTPTQRMVFDTNQVSFYANAGFERIRMSWAYLWLINDNAYLSFGSGLRTKLYEEAAATISMCGNAATDVSTFRTANLSATNVKATTVTATNVSATNISATTITATTFSGTNVYASSLCALGNPAKIDFGVTGYEANVNYIGVNAGAEGDTDFLCRGDLNFRLNGSGADNFRMTYSSPDELFQGMRDSKNLKIGKVALASDLAASNFYLYGQDAYSSASTNVNGGHTYIRGGNKAGAGTAGNVYLASDGTNAVGAIVASGNLSAGNLYATTVTATNVSATTLCGTLLAPNGAVATPGIAFCAQPGTGLYKTASYMVLTYNGDDRAGVNADRFSYYGFLDMGWQGDSLIYRKAANYIAFSGAAATDDATFRTSTISAVNVKATTVTATNLSSTNVCATTITATDFSGTNVKATTVTATNLSSTNVCATTITATTFSGTNVKATTITATDVSATSVSATTITATTFSGTNVKSTLVTATDLSGTNLSGTNSYVTTVTATNVKATTITATTLTSTDICATTVTATTFSGANVKATTITATSVCATNMTATAITATNITAVNVSATTYQNIGTNKPMVCWSVPGTLSANTSVPATPPFVMPYAATILCAYCRVTTSANGGGIIVDIHKNGTSIWTTQTNRLCASTGTISGVQNTFNTTALVEADALDFYVDVVGSTASGANLFVGLTLTT